MVMDIVHNIEYIVTFNKPVDYFDTVLQKQIDTRFKCEKCSSEEIIVIKLKYSDDILLCSEFIEKFGSLFNNYDIRYNFLELNNSPNKYKIINELYKKFCLYNIRELRHYKLEKVEDGVGMEVIISYEEFEYYFETMLEELHLFLNTYEFTDGEKKFIDSIVMDEKLKPNIKFAGWIDEWCNY